MFTKSAAVLSAGRSGSMLIFRNLAVAHYSLKENSQILGGQENLAELNTRRMIFHSHNKFDSNQFDNILPIFSVRRDIHETLISHYISNHNHQWHLHSHETAEKRDKITVDFAVLQNLIDQHLSWYRWYHRQLSPGAVIVVYETLVDYLNPDTCAYQKIYPNKHLLVSNWDDTIDYLEKSLTTEFQQLHQSFIDYESPPDQGIYQWASYQG
jgi:hypothetical protein